ncbi:MAG: hypothetical protein GC202_05235 [Alphaproteobacteria bacterium]|nr:hypothetical protein [Alphaproteobacteria bacterium]
MIHAAIKDSGGPAELPVSTRQRPDGRPEPTVIGKKTLDELVRFGGDPENAAAFLRNFEELRSRKHNGDKVRNSQFLSP